MKKYSIILLVLAFTVNLVNAQIDRSKAPISNKTPEIKMGDVKQFQLKNGLHVILVENHKLPQVRVSLSLDLPPVLEGDKVGITSLVGDMLRAGTTQYTKEELDLKIDELGSDFWSHSKGAGVSSLTKQLESSVELLAEIIKKANFTNQKELDKLKKQQITALESDAKNPDVISSRVSDVLLFGKNHPYGEYITEESIKRISLTDIKNYYNQYFNASNGYLVVVGDINEKQTKKLAENYFSDWRKGTKAQASFPTPSNVSKTEIDIVNLPSATQSLINITNLSPLKKSNSDYFSAKLANTILGGGNFGSRLIQNIREDKGWTYGAYSKLDSDADVIGVFGASAKVRNEVTDSAVVEFMKELQKITSEKPIGKEVKNMKTWATGIFALRLERPETVANFVLEQITNNLGNDFYKNYLKNLNAVTGTEILTASKKYIKPNQARIVIVGKADDIVPGLRKLQYPINFYDRFGNPIGDPTIKKSAGKATAQSVIKDYFKAIGGEEKLRSITSIKEIYNADFSAVVPAPLKVYNLKGAPNKFSSTMTIPSMNNALISKVVFDGTKGYEQDTQSKTNFETKKIEELKSENALFPQLNYKNPVLKGIVQLNGHDVYEIVTDKKTEYYNTKTYLLEREIRIEENEGKQVAVTVNFSNYKEFKGIIVPYFNELIIPDMPGSIKATLKEIDFNVETSDLDFQ
ncbi:MAG: M16 family metallopeptidase [Flavobacteriales bacterium]